jgi:glycosyltransferase involved in cell wall biosynthesis
MTTRVALITPPLDSSGGIGRLMSYVVAAMPAENIAITLLDPRGHARRPVLSIFPLARAWAALILLGLRRRIDVAHINVSKHGSSIRKPIMLWTCRMLRIPIVLHLHDGDYPEFFSGLPPLPKALLRMTFSRADLVIVLGARWRDYLCDELRVPAEKVVVLLNAAPGPSHLNSARSRGTAPLKILFLGKLCERKGVPEMLDALADPRVRDAPWLATLAGHGEIAHYRAQAQRLGLGERVTFSGWVDSEEVSALLAESDLLLLPSYAEGLSMSVIEAFAQGAAVVSTPVGAIPEILEDGVNGLLVSPGDAGGLAHAVLTLLEDEPLRQRLAANGRRTWEEGLTISSFTQQLAFCWRRVAKGTPQQALLV